MKIFLFAATLFLAQMNAIAASALPTDSVFAATSFWYKPIPANAPLNTKSAQFSAEFLRQMKKYYGHVGVNTTSYASPVYYVNDTHPKVKVTEWDCGGKGFLDGGLKSQWALLPMPKYARQANGTDAEMTIYDRSSNRIWEFWKARKVNGAWQACWGGRMLEASRTDGRWFTYYGATATGLPFLGGQVTAEELQRGEIRHVIGIGLPNSEKGGSKSGFSWPAKRSDGRNQDNVVNPIPQGARFRLDPSINVDALKMHPVARTIAKAAQKYGFVVWDTGGAAGIRMQNPLGYIAAGQGNPYTALFNGTPSYELLKGIPWDKLQFMPRDYGKPPVQGITP